MSIRFQIIGLVEGFEIVKDLAAQDYAEAGLAGHDFKINRSFYEMIDADGESFGVIAFDDDKPVGFCSVLMMDHQHTSEHQAANDTIYVLPEYRARGVGGRLVLLAEREAKARGAVFFQWGVPKDSPLARALERRCSGRIEVMYTREL